MIPSYENFMLPFLQILGDDKEHSRKEMKELLANYFKLTESEKNESFTSGRPILGNRVGWSRTYLKMAGLIEYPKRGVFRITANGKEVLKQNPDKIDIKFLKQFPGFIDFLKGNIKDSEISESLSKSIVDIATPELYTPEETIEKSYQQIRQSLEQEILSKLKVVNTYFFEKIVVELLVKMGYGGSIQDAGKVIGKSGDEGIDGIIKEDKLGLDTIYIQAKRWEGIVGRPEIQKFVGALAGQRAKKGVFITTSSFTKEASAYALQMDTKIVLIDGETLAQYMIDYNLGVSVQNTYEIKKIDSDYFEEE
jgi:restriction system protein